MTLSDKKALRRVVRADIAKLSAEEKCSLSAQIFNRTKSLKEIEEASVIALFASLPDEPQTTEIIAKFSKSKRIVLPRVEGEEMNFYDIADGLQSGAFGIMEPTSTTPIEPNKIDVMIVPGVAFTSNGKRLGRGKGFYDKYLSHKGFRAYTIGVCYPCQVVKSLPTEEHDKMLDKVIYE